ncbi:hypothetical protein KKD03_00665 [Patescibacteria group bacterium]|nr:hypothetical protein [Patescibacteria group bacterium]
MKTVEQVTAQQSTGRQDLLNRLLNSDLEPDQSDKVQTILHRAHNQYFSPADIDFLRALGVSATNLSLFPTLAEDSKSKVEIDSAPERDTRFN